MMVKYPKVIRHGNETWEILASNDLGVGVCDRLRVVDDIFFNAKVRKGKRKGMSSDTLRERRGRFAE
jgi:hypothetical protein